MNKDLPTALKILCTDSRWRMSDELPLPYVRLKAMGERFWNDADVRLKTVKDRRSLAAFQKELGKTFADVMGPLPDMARRIPFSKDFAAKCDGIAIERITMTSEFGYLITGWTYTCKGRRGSRPGLVVASGHAEAGSLHKPYVRLALYAARLGFYVLAFDPPGQGARREVFLPTDHPVYWSPCNQHQHMGAAATLAGFNLARFFVSDCVTAVSFLSQRKEVDSARIGFAGQSGGGLQTYLAIGADPRISAAVPCQATDSRRVAFKNVKSNDIEQTFPRAWSAGLDLVEMGALFAPKPLRIIAEFGCPNQLDVFLKLQPIYKALGAEDKIELASATVEHQLPRSCRELIMSWLVRHLSPETGMRLEPESPGFDKTLEAMNKAVAGLNAKGGGIVAWCQRQPATTFENVGKELESNPFLRGAIHRRSYPITDGKCWLSPDYPIPFSLEKGGSERLAVIVDEKGMDSAWSKGKRRRLLNHGLGVPTPRRLQLRETSLQHKGAKRQPVVHRTLLAIYTDRTTITHRTPSWPTLPHRPGPGGDHGRHQLAEIVKKNTVPVRARLARADTADIERVPPPRAGVPH